MERAGGGGVFGERTRADPGAETDAAVVVSPLESRELSGCYRR